MEVQTLRNHRQIQTGRKIAYVKYRLRQIPRWMIVTMLLWVIAEAILYSAIITNWLAPDWSNRMINPWASPWYSNPMYASWWVKFLSEPISRLVYYYCGCRMALRLGDFFFLISIIFLGFRILDLMMFFWNFCRSSLLYADMFFTLITLLWTAIKGYKPETLARIKSIF